MNGSGTKFRSGRRKKFKMVRRNSRKVDQSEINSALHQGYKDHWVGEKKAAKKWLSKEDYEKKTGKPGKA